ncbi:hypothetical protein [Tenacibaculum ovolyticum]|uniref:hypothetical protein n=1 Tax=Tenacibaculum ovolyticum TaxID=104270 RepID=UPI000AD85959|nr:hypothetical protein [Tenacibaculum ovolyticum]
MYYKIYEKEKSILLLLILPFILILASNYSVENNAQNKTYSDASKIKKNKVGLVLGTAKT